MANVISNDEHRNTDAVYNFRDESREVAFVANEYSATRNTHVSERRRFMSGVYKKVEEAERDVAAQKITKGFGHIDSLIQKYAI